MPLPTDTGSDIRQESSCWQIQASAAVPYNSHSLKLIKTLFSHLFQATTVGLTFDVVVQCLSGPIRLPFHEDHHSKPFRYVEEIRLYVYIFAISLLQIVRTPQYFYKEREEAFRIKKLRMSPDRP